MTTTMNPTTTPGTTVPTSSSSRPFARKMKRGFFYFVGALILLAALTVFLLMNVSYSDGYRVGTIQKISKKGVLFKSYEGDLAQGFLDTDPNMDANGVATRTWPFTVPASETEVLRQIDHAIETSKRVKLYYKERYRTLPWVGDTRYVVYKVEEISGNPGPNTYPATQGGTIQPPAGQPPIQH